jgi:hypothetical protein
MRKEVEKNTVEVDEELPDDLAVDVELEDVPEDELIDEDALLEEDDLDEDAVFLDDEDAVEDADADADIVDIVDLEVGPAVEPVEVVTVPLETEAAASEEEDDDLEDDDDVEASLDVILKERLVVDDEDDDEDDTPDLEDRADGNLRVLPKQPGEFVCQSCFLVKHQGQLADAKRGLCRDCV